MKRILSSILGVTLLEIMLVLAIAAMIIVMSVRYYQSATANEQTNSAIEEIEAISAAADELEQSTGNYQNISNTLLEPLLPSNGLYSPWGTQINVAGASTTSYTIQIYLVPAQICELLVAKITNNNHYSLTNGSCQSTAQTLIFTYNASP